MKSIVLTNAFVLTQFSLLLIVFLGIMVLRAGETNMSALYSRPATRRFPFLFAGFALVTIGLLIFSEDVVLSSRPVFGDIELPSISKDTAFLVVFSVDLLGAAFLILLTGGSKDSPFSAILLVLPALAIFMREPPQRFLSYTFVAAVLFLLVQADLAWRTIQENPYHRITFMFVTLSCLGLSTMVGYATRPQ